MNLFHNLTTFRTFKFVFLFQINVVNKCKGILRPFTRKAKAQQNSGRCQDIEERAANHYRKAGNHFKMAKNWSSAGYAFAQSAKYREIPYDSSTDNVEAANCYKKVEPEKAIQCLSKAAEIQIGNGKYQLAAKYHEEMGKIFEGWKRIEEAIQHYEMAGEYFRSELKNAAGNRCYLKAAELAATIDEFDKAIKIYEDIAPRALESNLLKYSAEDHYFRAALCHLCVDFLNAHHALTRYSDEYPAFNDSRKGINSKTTLL